MKIYKQCPPELFLGKDVLKTCSKFTREHTCQSVISTKLQRTDVLRHGCSPVNLLHIFKTTFYKNTSGGFFMEIVEQRNTTRKYQHGPLRFSSHRILIP